MLAEFKFNNDQSVIFNVMVNDDMKGTTKMKKIQARYKQRSHIS